MDFSKFVIPNVSNYRDSIKVHIEGLQAQLGPNQELTVLCESAHEVLTVRRIGFAVNSPFVAILGTDAGGELCHILTHIDSLQLLLKIHKVDPEENRAPYRIGFVTEQSQPTASAVTPADEDDPSGHSPGNPAADVWML